MLMHRPRKKEGRTARHRFVVWMTAVVLLGFAPVSLNELLDMESLLPLSVRASEVERRNSGVSKVRHIDLVHFSHTDYGFTDHPVICRELQKRYLDIAIDAVLTTRDGPEDKKFCWTTETTVAVNDWWQTATETRRADLLKAVESGQLEVSALPLNPTPTLNRQQWHKMLHWLPE